MVDGGCRLLDGTALAGVRMTWQQHAACRGMDPNLFVPAKGEPIAQAQAVCRGCPVRQQCADYAIGDPELRGVWGGLSDRARQAERHRRNLPRRHHNITRIVVCGTVSGFSRHKDRGEQPCDLCRETYNAYQRQYRKARKDAVA